MSDKRFHDALFGAVDKSAAELELRSGVIVPRSYLIEFHGLGRSGELLDLKNVEGLLYLDSDRYFKIIDVGVRAIRENMSVVFVRPSGHAPVPWAETWNPDQFGPFKLLEFEVVVDA